ncbi:MAG: hypothetical protein D3910_20230, partial [Candidatus Electrothrix sp. ATG2]|nr:hypothetical protein [Candidatus Electrothrix sp. ATG2]
AEQQRADAEKAAEEARLEEERQAELKRIEEEKAAWYNSLNEAERCTYDLNGTVEAYKPHILVQQQQDTIRRQMKKILVSKGWPRSDKEKAFEAIERACPLVFKKKKLKKKKAEAKRWLETENGE